MCFADGSLAPAAPDAGAAGPSRALTLTAADGAVPLLLLHAGADAHIPLKDTQRLAERAPDGSRLVVFDGAPHSFFDRTAPQHAEACVRAWGEVRAFVGGTGS